MQSQLKAAYTTTLVGAILFVLESISDFFLAQVYAEVAQDFLGASASADVVSGMQLLAVVGLVVSVVLVAFLLIERNRLQSWHFIVVLVVAVGSIVLTSALYALIVVIIGSIIGIVKSSQK